MAYPSINASKADAKTAKVERIALQNILRLLDQTAYCLEIGPVNELIHFLYERNASPTHHC